MVLGGMMTGEGRETSGWRVSRLVVVGKGGLVEGWGALRGGGGLWGGAAGGGRGARRCICWVATGWRLWRQRGGGVAAAVVHDAEEGTG